MADVLRKNSALGKRLGDGGRRFLAHAVGAIERLLPHTDALERAQIPWEPPGAHFVGSGRRAIRVVFSFDSKEEGSSVQVVVTRRQRRLRVGDGLKTMDLGEHEICGRIAIRTSSVLALDNHQGPESLEAIRAAFDGQIVADMLATGHSAQELLPSILGWLNQLAQQTYENRSLSFGCIISRKRPIRRDTPRFPDDFLTLKRYRVMSDGFRTAYEVDRAGHLVQLVDLRANKSRELSATHWFPEWARDLARASAKSPCAIALTWQGDILILEKGTLRFTYRFGRWQHWNHRHLIHVLESLCRRQRVPRGKVRTVVATAYRAALDASFRRTGALFVILGRRRSLRKIVRAGDAIDDDGRDPRHEAFDRAILTS